MRFLFVTYCFGDDSGQTLVGVYKRGLRVALELHARGHEVLFDCTGRSTYRDELTAAAEERLQFVDLGLVLGTDRNAQEARARAVAAVAACEADLIVVGEAPLAGTLLESTLCGAELGIPVAVLDNAYNDDAAREFVQNHGGMVDAVVLTGPTCAHTKEPPPELAQVPPFVTSDPERARRLLTSLGVGADRLVTVLGYDARTERLGLSLLGRLEDDRAEFVVVSRRAAETLRHTSALAPGLRARVHVVDLLADPVLFGLIELSRLAVVKYGFMQVTECLSLRTPVVCAFHEGATWVDLLPRECAAFVHVASSDEADARTVTAVQEFLRGGDDDLARVHDGRFDAAVRAADFLERAPAHNGRPRAPRVPERELREAVGRHVGRSDAVPTMVRSMRIRSSPDRELHAVVCRCRVDGEERIVRLWAHRYRSALAISHAVVRSRLGGRRVLAASRRARVLIEPDLGHARLPPL